MIKLTILLRRRADLSHAEFVAYHRERHAPLFAAQPEVRQHVRRYVQCHAGDDALPGLPDSRIDGSTELWFDDLDGLAALFTAPAYLETIRPDEERFLDLHACEMFLGSEREVIPLAPSTARA